MMMMMMVVVVVVVTMIMHDVHHHHSCPSRRRRRQWRFWCDRRPNANAQMRPHTGRLKLRQQLGWPQFSSAEVTMLVSFGHTNILHTLVGMGSAVLVVAWCALPRKGDPNFPGETRKY